MVEVIIGVTDDVVFIHAMEGHTLLSEGIYSLSGSGIEVLQVMGLDIHHSSQLSVDRLVHSDTLFFHESVVVGQISHLSQVVLRDGTKNHWGGYYFGGVQNALNSVLRLAVLDSD